MKGYWEYDVRQRFYRAFDELQSLQKDLPALLLDYDCDSDRLDFIFDMVCSSAGKLQAALDMYEVLLCSRRAAADAAADLEGLLL